MCVCDMYIILYMCISIAVLNSLCARVCVRVCERVCVRARVCVCEYSVYSWQSTARVLTLYILFHAGSCTGKQHYNRGYH